MNKLYFIVFILVLGISCKKENNLETQIANIGIDVKVERFDTLMATANNLPRLKQAYPFMFAKQYPDSFWVEKINDTLQIELSKEVSTSFKNFTKVEEEVEALFNHLKYYYPNFKAPRVITTTSDVDYKSRTVVTDSIVLIALDNYLGSNHKFYGGIPIYIKEDLNPEQIVVDMATQYAYKYINQPERKTLLDEMVYFGKALYFKDLMLPFKTEASRLGYTAGELQWAQANEAQVWQYFVERELLFSTDSKLSGRFITPAPFSKFYLEGIDAESPGQIGQYMGWQIVRAYMNNNDANLNNMLRTSPMEIFNKSKFKPRK
ncbi:MAG: gliding motility lipoprotein GldB [Flavobacteriaceae bacterium]